MGKTRKGEYKTKVWGGNNLSDSINWLPWIGTKVLRLDPFFCRRRIHRQDRQYEITIREVKKGKP